MCYVVGLCVPMLHLYRVTLNLESDVMAIYIIFLTYVTLTNRFYRSSSGRIETFYFLLNQICEFRSVFCREQVGIMIPMNGRGWDDLLVDSPKLTLTDVN